MSLKILHIAPQNFAGMPIDFVKMHRASGFESRLVTLYKSSISFEEDICLNFKLPEGGIFKKWRDSKITGSIPGKMKFIEPKNDLEKIYFSLRDFKNKKKILEAIKKHKLMDYDVYHFDGGMDLFRDLRFASELKRRNKKIVCCYFGSDLRTRGIFRELDDMSDLNLTVEFDHLSLHRNINYLYFPFDNNPFKPALKNNPVPKIIHTPTNRRFKGTDKILNVIDKLKQERNFEFILLENTERSKVLEIKNTCDIAIDQVGGEMGGSGYGKNSVETLAMGIPTVTEFSEQYLNFIPENPFVHSVIENLGDNIKKLIDDLKLRNELSEKGIKWIKKYHSFESVNAALLELYRKHKITEDI